MRRLCTPRRAASAIASPDIGMTEGLDPAQVTVAVCMRRRRALRAVGAMCGLGLLVACTGRGAFMVAEPFLERSPRHAGQRVRYRVFVPRVDKGGRRPVVLFLHGSGERGTDNLAQTRAGLGPALRRMPEFPAIVVFPQSPPGHNWSGAVADAAMAALDDAIHAFDGDPQRVTLTGMSRGGYGVWELALAYPDRFAALAPVCSGIEPQPGYDDLYVAALRDAPDPYAELARRLHATPAWLFHGARDDLVVPENSRRIVAALQAAGGSPRYTEFPDANHNSWDAAYAMSELWDWMFAQRRE